MAAVSESVSAKAKVMSKVKSKVKSKAVSKVKSASLQLKSPLQTADSHGYQLLRTLVMQLGRWLCYPYPGPGLLPQLLHCGVPIFAGMTWCAYYFWMDCLTRYLP